MPHITNAVIYGQHGWHHRHGVLRAFEENSRNIFALTARNFCSLTVAGGRTPATKSFKKCFIRC